MLFWCLLIFQNQLFGNTISVKKFGSRSSLTLCRTWSGSKLFAKVISRWHWRVVNKFCDSCFHNLRKDLTLHVNLLTYQALYSFLSLLQLLAMKCLLLYFPLGRLGFCGDSLFSELTLRETRLPVRDVPAKDKHISRPCVAGRRPRREAEG